MPTNREDAKAALIAMGIAPTRGLIEGWLKAAAESQMASEPAPSPRNAPPLATGETAPVPQPARSSRSRLEPILREQGALVEPAKRRKPGRFRIVASWFPAVSQTMADGTSLRAALAINGLSLSENEMRALYRNRTFQPMYQEARRRYFIEHYGRKPTLRALVGQYV